MGRVPPLRGRGTALRFGGGRSPGCSRAAVQARAVIPLGEHARFFSPCICSRGLDKDLRWRPYHVECTGSLPNSEVKRRRARLVLGWGTAREDLRVLPAFHFQLSFAPWGANGGRDEKGDDNERRSPGTHSLGDARDRRRARNADGAKEMGMFLNQRDSNRPRKRRRPA